MTVAKITFQSVTHHFFLFINDEKQPFITTTLDTFLLSHSCIIDEHISHISQLVSHILPLLLSMVLQATAGIKRFLHIYKYHELRLKIIDLVQLEKKITVIAQVGNIISPVLLHFLQIKISVMTNRGLGLVFKIFITGNGT